MGGTGPVNKKGSAMRPALLVVSLLVLFLPSVAFAVAFDADAEADGLITLEKSKWEAPGSGTGLETVIHLFADDFISVEYGTDLSGVVRKTRDEVFSGPPLPSAAFNLTEWKVLRPSADVVLLSYHVKSLSFPWQAYATSVWTRRDGAWKTIFYQASTAR